MGQDKKNRDAWDYAFNSSMSGLAVSIFLPLMSVLSGCIVINSGYSTAIGGTSFSMIGLAMGAVFIKRMNWQAVPGLAIITLISGYVLGVLFGGVAGFMVYKLFA